MLPSGRWRSWLNAAVEDGGTTSADVVTPATPAPVTPDAVPPAPVPPAPATPAPVPPAPVPPAPAAAVAAPVAMGIPSATPSAGWFPDPNGRAVQRYWDGARWTAHVHDGVMTVDEASPAALLGQMRALGVVMFRERPKSRVGSHLDLHGADGRPLGWATAPPDDPPNGVLKLSKVPELWTTMFSAGGVRLGALRRPAGREMVDDHVVFDANGVPVGAYRKTSWRVVTLLGGVGKVGELNFHLGDTWFFDTNRVAIAHLRRFTENLGRFRSINKPETDHYTLELLAPLPDWLLLLILFSPIEANMRVDVAREVSRSAVKNQ